MALAIILVVLLIGSIIFNFVSPWQATPVASNWGSIDTTILITFIITGIFFVAITLFIVYALIKYRHREGGGNGAHQASYEPDNKRLEWGLTAITTIGICGLLAPGLVVYGDFVSVPEEAHEIEVMGKQWMWSFRLPGEDGEFGHSGIKHINMANPFGLDPDDPNGQDDIIVNSNELHLPIDQPVKMLLRSIDVLHNFYVPQFRAKMDMVPGQVSYFWMTPTKEGSYEILCAEYCGVAHYNMKGKVIVESASDYQDWVASHSTFARQLAINTSGGTNESALQQGLQLSQNSGCLACHSVDGSESLGPTWKGLWGKTETLADGSTVVVDEAYFKESILDPNAKMVKGYAPVMAPYEFSDSQLDAIILYVRSLDEDPAALEEQADQSSLLPSLEEQGEQIAQTLGCIACHSVDGSRSVGPTWKGMYGRTQALVDGTEIVVDEAYLRESILNPSAKVVAGFSPIMQAYALNEQQLEALIAFAKVVSE